MMSIDILQSLIAVASSTDRADVTENQDAVATAENATCALKVVILADGIGSHAHAGLGAQWAVKAAAEEITKAESVDAKTFWEVFRHARSRVREQAEAYGKQNTTEVDREHADLGIGEVVAEASTKTESVDGGTLWQACRKSLKSLCSTFGSTPLRVKRQSEAYRVQDKEFDREQSFGTTLLMAGETETELWLGYVGNGGIWHLRGSFNEFSPNRYLPWNAVNYLNPHTLENDLGKEALYRLISPSDCEEKSEPTILRLNKDCERGDIVMVCTDGIFSNDQACVGRFRDGSTWSKAELAMLRFFDILDQFFAQDSSALDATLKNYVQSLRTECLLDDDASVGVIITAPALRYQDKRRQRTRKCSEDAAHSRTTNGGA